MGQRVSAFDDEENELFNLFQLTQLHNQHRARMETSVGRMAPTGLIAKHPRTNQLLEYESGQRCRR